MTVHENTSANVRLGIHPGDYVAVQKIVKGEWYVDTEKGEVHNLLTGKPVAFVASNTGYLKTTVRTGHGIIGISKQRIVWIAANLPNYLPLNYNLIVDHINGDQLDNRIANLQLITQSENIKKGIHRIANSRFTDDEVREIRVKHVNGKKYSELAREYKVDVSTISRLVRRINYGWVE